MTRKRYYIANIIAISSLLFACAESATESEESNKENEEATEEVQEAAGTEMPSEASFKFDLIIANNIAAPVKLLTDMNKAGLNHYQADVTNSTDKLDSYQTSDEKALAFGVYGADLSYKSLYQRNEDMADYLITIRKISADLGLDHLFDPAAIETFDRIKENPDSVKLFIFDKYDEADSYLRDNDRLSTATLILTGGLIESLHLVSTQIESGDATKDAYMIFLEQKSTLKNLIDLYGNLEANGHKIEIKKDVESLYAEFEKVSSFDKFSKESMRPLHEAVRNVRNSII